MGLWGSRSLRPVSLFIIIATVFVSSSLSAQTSAPTCTLSVTPSSGPPPLTVTATGTCNQGSLALASMSLDFGDGSAPQTQSSAGKSQDTITGMHTYASSGSYVVTVTATDIRQQTGTAQQDVFVNQPPSCTFTVDKNIGPVPFTINPTISCTDPEHD